MGTDVLPEASLKEKLKVIESDINGWRDERVEKAKERDAAKGLFAGTEGYDMEGTEFKAAEHAVAEVGQLDEKIASAQAAQVAVLKMLGQRDPQAAKAMKAAAEGDGGSQPRGWDAKSVLDAGDMRSRLEKIATSKSKFGSFELGEVASREVLKTDLDGTTDMRRGPWAGIIPQLQRPLRVLPLIPKGTTNSNTLPYTQESGTYGAAETTEGSTKPQDGEVLTDQTATAETIAVWQKVKRQTLADTDVLQGLIENRLRYSVMRRVESQIIAGDGTGSNLTGIIHTPGIQTVPYASTKLPADQILAGLTAILIANGEPESIVLNPLDWESILTQKATGDGQYFSGGPFRVTAQTMWGVPLAASTAIDAGESLVADWTLGATLLIREGVNLLLSDSDGTDFVQNRVTILAEGRFMLPVWQPSVFAFVAVGPTS